LLINNDDDGYDNVGLDDVEMMMMMMMMISLYV